MEYELDGDLGRPEIDQEIISLIENVESEDIIYGCEPENI